MMLEKRSVGCLIRAGYRRFWKACQPINHSITGDAAMAHEAASSEQPMVIW
jgi:hypothetical protein